MKKIACVFLITTSFLFSIGCSDPSPKPMGYFRIELEKPDYAVYSNDSLCFSFLIPSNVEIVNVADTLPSGRWMNIVYPALNARIYCSYLPITSSTLRNEAEVSRKFVYVHAVKADAISEQVYTNPEQQVYGIIYTLKGNVATPIQFVLTDSVRHFFRGALYFDYTPNKDSIAPTLDHIREDIQKLVAGFQWKNK